MTIHCNPVRIRGITYPSQKAAAEALGLHPTTIANALNGGYLEEVGLRRGGHPGKPCFYRGKAYPSRQAAATAWGVSRAYISKQLAKASQQRDLERWAA